MQYLIATSQTASLDSIAACLGDLDPSALVDVDTAGRLRISTMLHDAEVLIALGLAGLFVAPAELERQPTECCGGCGG